MISAFDRIDQQHRARPLIALEAFSEGQECPKPDCRGRLELRGDGPCQCVDVDRPPCFSCEHVVLACDADCGWTEREVRL